MKRVILCGIGAVMLTALLASCGGGGGAADTNPTYTITYDGNGNTGGSVPMDSTRYEQGQTVTVLGNTGNLVKSGYTFAGWNTQADGNGTTYVESQTITIGAANIILYAKWIQPTKAVLTLGTSGTLSSGNISAIGLTITLPNGVTVKTDANGNVDSTVVVPSGVDAGAASVTAIYTAATTTLQGKLNFLITSTNLNGFGTGEFATVTCDINSGNPNAGDFSMSNFSNFSPYDLLFNPITGLTLGYTADIK